jgi:hypothetical protein
MQTDRESLEFHIAANDFFGTAATVLDLVRQDLEKSGYRKRHGHSLRRVRDTLVYLQRNYRIVDGES